MRGPMHYMYLKTPGKPMVNACGQGGEGVTRPWDVECGKCLRTAVLKAALPPPPAPLPTLAKGTRLQCGQIGIGTITHDYLGRDELRLAWDDGGRCSVSSDDLRRYLRNGWVVLDA